MTGGAETRCPRGQSLEALWSKALFYVVDLLEFHDIRVEVVDERFAGVPIEVTFQGELRPLQCEAATALLARDIGILSATTAFGKTVVAAWFIAARRVNTLVLVHRRQLLDQWSERLAAFLDLPPRAICECSSKS